MVGLAEELLPAPEAREEQRPRRPRPPRRLRRDAARVAPELLVEVLPRGVRVAQHELQHLVLARVGADRQRPRVLVGADDVAHQQFPVAERGLPLAHLEPDEERMAHQRLLAFSRHLEDLAQHLHRRGAAERVDDVVLALGDRHRVAERPAALRDDRVDREVAVQCDADGAGAEELLVEEERVLPRRLAAAGEAADLASRRVRSVEAAHQRLGFRGEGVGQQDEVRAVRWRHADQRVPRVGVRRRRERTAGGDPERRDRHTGQHRRGDRQRRRSLDLASVADHAAAAAAGNRGAREEERRRSPGRGRRTRRGPRTRRRGPGPARPRRARP